MLRKETLQFKKLNGICYDCERKAINGKSRCLIHLKTNKNSVKKYKKTDNGILLKRKLDKNLKRRKRRRTTYRFKYVKSHVLRKGKKWDITEKDWYNIINKPCYYCYLPNDVETGRGLDRLDNSKDYTLDNVVSCCALCNSTRGNRFSVNEMKLIGKIIKEIKLNRLNRNII